MKKTILFLFTAAVLVVLSIASFKSNPSSPKQVIDSFLNNIRHHSYSKSYDLLDSKMHSMISSDNFVTFVSSALPLAHMNSYQIFFVNNVKYQYLVKLEGTDIRNDLWIDMSEDKTDWKIKDITLSPREGNAININSVDYTNTVLNSFLLTKVKILPFYSEQFDKGGENVLSTESGMTLWPHFNKAFLGTDETQPQPIFNVKCINTEDAKVILEDTFNVFETNDSGDDHYTSYQISNNDNPLSPGNYKCNVSPWNLGAQKMAAYDVSFTMPGKITLDTIKLYPW